MIRKSRTLSRKAAPPVGDARSIKTRRSTATGEIERLRNEFPPRQRSLSNFKTNESIGDWDGNSTCRHHIARGIAAVSCDMVRSRLCGGTARRAMTEATISGPPARMRGILWVVGSVVGALVAAGVILWAHFGGAVFSR